jgi:hypothetical protein
MKTPAAIAISWLVLTSFAGLTPAAPEDTALFLRHTPYGLMLASDLGLPADSSHLLVRDASVVWSNYLEDAIYTTTANCPDGYALAGTYLNPPKETRLFAPSGGGTPTWKYPGNEFYVDASDKAPTLAAVDKTSSDITVIKWTGPGDGVPDWTARVPGYSVNSYGCIAVSDDGSTIAVVASPPGTDAHLLLFDENSATPLVDYQATGLGFQRYVKINADGRYTAFIALATAVVFDRDLLDVRAEIPMGATNSALDISGDGDLVAFGWSTMQVRQWNGSSYGSLWNYSTPGYHLSKVTISTDGTTIASAWYDSGFTSLRIIAHDASSATPLWIYDYPSTSGTYQEQCGDIDVTDNGRYFIVGSWGDAEDRNPEVHIFDRDASPPLYYTLNMPGSMFSVDIAGDGSYATACGKHIHANQTGRGGDAVLIDTDIATGAADDSAGRSMQALAVTGYPNPLSTQTTISFRLPETVAVSLEIYDMLGRRVACLASSQQPAGLQSVFWNATDHSGSPVSSGVYFVKLRAAGQVQTQKLVIMR